MLTRLLIAMLVLAGPTPLRICTCVGEDEPILAAAGEEHEDHDCHCPVAKPVAKVAASPYSPNTDPSFAYLLPIPQLDCSPVDVEQPTSRLSRAPQHPSAPPLYLTLRTLRN